METCWFCETNPSEPKSSYERKLHLETGRSGGVKFQKVHYTVKTVTVPRCEVCRKQHLRNKVLQGIVAVGLVGSGVPAYLLTRSWWITALVALATAVVAVGIDFFIRSKRVPTFLKMKDQDAFREYPIVKQMLEDGWGVGDPVSGLG